jgi:thiopurine S-methyltransferase
MQPQFWIKAWEDGRRGFHVEQPNPHLVEHAVSLFAPGSRILVPLCGATHDLQWLVDHGYEAVGIELSPLAARELAERDGLEEVATGRYEKPGVTVLVADFFGVTPERVGRTDGIWDRAALIAMHPEQRVAYVAKERELLGGAGTLLLNVMAYDQSHFDGPPWSVDHDAVAFLWPEAVCFHDVENAAMPRFQEQGVDTVHSRLYRATLG